MKLIDLHVHTNFSDGTFSPKEVVDLALKGGVRIIAITDHDTIGGIRDAKDYANGKDIKIISGIEISCKEKELQENPLHIIGLFIDEDKILLKKEMNIREAVKIIKNSGGIPIIAHPGIYPESKKILDKFVDNGGEGIEVSYPYDKIYKLDKNKIERFFRNFAEKNNLLVSGGSDFHGLNRIEIKIGDEGISEEEFLVLKSFKNI